jgi:hypothetical protein
MLEQMVVTPSLALLHLLVAVMAHRVVPMGGLAGREVLVETFLEQLLVLGTRHQHHHRKVIMAVLI